MLMIGCGAYGNIMCLLLLASIVEALSPSIREDINKIQASRLLLHSSTNPLVQTATSLTATHIKPFLTQPTLIYGICDMKMSNSNDLQYMLATISISQTDFTFEFTVGQTKVYRLYVNAVALDFYGVTSEIVTYGTIFTNKVPIQCLNKQTNQRCTEFYKTPKPNTDYLMVNLLVGLDLANDFLSTYLDKTYFLNITRNFVTNSTDNESYFDVVQGFSIQVRNFTLCWFIIERPTVNSDNITILIVGREMSRNSFYSIPNLYSTGYQASTNETFVAVLGLSLDPGNQIDFTLYFQNANLLRSRIYNVTPTTSSVSLFTILLVFGAPYCSTGILVMYPSAVCQTCDMSRCATCSILLCATCQPNRFLHILNQTSGSGDCLCQQGYVQVNTVCTACDPKCTKCSGDPSNCTQCLYGYHLLGNFCTKYCFVSDLQLAMVLDCQQCPEGCTICQTSSNCSVKTCTNNFYNDTCLDVCPDGTYAANINNVNICMKCSAECQQCSQPMQCLTCSDGYYMWNGICLMCQYPCSRCQQPGTETCLSCVDGYTYTGASCQPTQIVVPCDAGYYEMLGSCVACPPRCLTCDQNGCYQCADEYLLKDGTCQQCNIVGYHVVKRECVEKCGDGIKIQHQCDDNNTVDGDGCSADCSVESGYLCQPSTHGDICYSMASTITVQLKRSLVNNKVEVRILFSDFNIANVRDWSIQCEHSGYTVTDIQVTQNVYAVVIYTEQMVDVWCHVHITQKKQLSFQVTTEPPAIYEQQHQVIGKVLMALAGISLLIMLPGQLIVPQLTASFINYSLLFIPQLFIKMHMPITFYESKYALSMLSMDWLQINGSQYLLSWQHQDSLNAIIVLSYVIISLVIVCSIHKKTQHTIFRPCFRAIRQCHNIFSSYEPILLINLCLIAKRQMTALNIIAICFIAVLSTADIVYTLWRSWHVKMFLAANDGPIQKVRYYLYCFVVMLVDRHHFRLGTMLGISLGMAVLGMKVYQAAKYGCHSIGILSVRHLKYFQRYLNELTFIVYNLIMVRLGIEYSTSSWFGYYLLANFGIFLFLNSIVVAWGIGLRIKEGRQPVLEATDRGEKLQAVSTIMSNTTVNLRYKGTKDSKASGSMEVRQMQYDDIIIEGLSEVDLEDRLEERKREEDERGPIKQTENIEDNSQFQSLIKDRNEDVHISESEGDEREHGQVSQILQLDEPVNPQQLPELPAAPQAQFIVREVESVLENDSEQASEIIDRY